jgi:hypothetical protein
MLATLTLALALQTVPPQPGHGGISSLPLFNQPVAHELGLHDHRYKLENRDKSQYPGEQHDPPILKRFGVALVAGVSGYWLALWGDGQRRLGRRRLGSAAIGVAILWFTLACGLFFLTGYAWSWGWRL